MAENVIREASEPPWHSTCSFLPGHLWATYEKAAVVFLNDLRRSVAVSEQEPKFWSNAQSYGMAIICLVLGVAAGYLLHAPAVASPSIPATEVSPPSPKPAPQMPSAADMKRMADKQVAPLLEQLQKNPNDPELLTKVAKAYMAAQQFQSAQQYYEKSIAAKPHVDALNELAFVYVKLGDLDRGIEALNKARALDPKNPQVLFNLGYFEWKGKADPKAAISAWQAFLKADPDSSKRAQVEQMMAQARKHLNIRAGTKTEKPAM
jgi:cytochrome c-type biogenesis protein CcmH/NrfG